MAVGAGLPEAMHGAGAPAAQKIMIERRANIERKKELAEIIAGVREDKYFQKITGTKEKDYFAEFRKRGSQKEA